MEETIKQKKPGDLLNLIKKNRDRCLYLVKEENGEQIKNPFDRQFRLFVADMRKDIQEQGQLL
jgi:hypothetical protein